ncbi:MAG TPA: DUF4398 domain-containing protein [Burkholderiales bacterium]|jgi:hypothetical protein|nr:DUF4398 domain-containing protein [Burkholderiales bacterium]
MQLLRQLFPPFALALLLTGVQIAGCVGAPVQEMSDARQAVRAAVRAGAEQHAPAELAEAQRFLDQAKGHLQHGKYREAREEAVQARDKALEARRIAEEATRAKP